MIMENSFYTVKNNITREYRRISVGKIFQNSLTINRNKIILIIYAILINYYIIIIFSFYSYRRQFKIFSINTLYIHIL